jgi:hypothetical protein
MAFTYLLNAPCLGNAEVRSEFRRGLADHLRWIAGAGASAVTVSIPLLLDVVRETVPELDVRISAIAHVGTPRRARLFEQLGASEITLDFQQNRNLERLAKIRAAVDLDLSLVVNDVCLFRCPFRTHCYNQLGHSSQDGGASFVVDHCSFRCFRVKTSDPTELLRSPWLRPQDLALVERETGIGRFKVSGRTKTTDQILRAVRAYSCQSWSGNLLDVLDGTARSANEGRFDLAREALDRGGALVGIGSSAVATAQRLLPKSRRSPLVSLLGHLDKASVEDLLRAYLALVTLSEAIHLDCEALDGFLEQVQTVDCDAECGSCLICGNWASKVVKTEPERIGQIVGALDRVLTGIVDGSYAVY